MEKMTFSRSCRWYTTIKRQTRIPRMTLNVCFLDFPDKKIMTDHKTEGEFHVDLYTLPDNLIKMLWDFTQEKGAL